MDHVANDTSSLYFCIHDRRNLAGSALPIEDHFLQFCCLCRPFTFLALWKNLAFYTGTDRDRKSLCRFTNGQKKVEAKMNTSAVVLYSGGTDSTCAAAIVAERVQKIHLLTFVERSTSKSPLPTENVKRLRAAFPNLEISHAVISTDKLVRWLSYGTTFFGYLDRLLKDHIFNLLTPGFSSLSWHLAALRYSSLIRLQGQENIVSIYDGMTRELTHLPGHMPVVREQIESLYRLCGFSLSSPVIDFPVPPDQKFIDRLVVDRHGFALRADIIPGERTTGKYLYERGILPHPNVKGSLFDVQMQHDCYPFIVYNMMIFWLLMPARSWASIESDIARIMSKRISEAEVLINDWADVRFEEPRFLDPERVRAE